MNNNSLISYLPRWVAKTIEVVQSYPGDVSFGIQNQIQKQHDNIALMTRVLGTYDHVSYSNSQERLEWEQAM
jgi:hypothetical protein